MTNLDKAMQDFNGFVFVLKENLSDGHCKPCRDPFLRHPVNISRVWLFVVKKCAHRIQMTNDRFVSFLKSVKSWTRLLETCAFNAFYPNCLCVIW